MEGRVALYTPDEITAWTKWANGQNLTDFNTEQEDCFTINNSEHNLEIQTQRDAVWWYRSRKLATRLKRLRPTHRLYRTIHLYIRGRANWPIQQIGAPPSTQAERTLVRQFCLNNHAKRPDLSPKNALTEYRSWWDTQRKNRSPSEQRIGDRVLNEAYDLRTALGKVSPRSELAQQLLLCKEDVRGCWPKGENIPSPPISQLAKDTFQDWLAASELSIRKFSEELYSGTRYRY
jgi:hypothetical protein